MTKKDLEQENARLRKGLEKIREIADDPKGYVKKKFSDLSGGYEYAVCIGAISSISAFTLFTLNEEIDWWITETKRRELNGRQRKRKGYRYKKGN